MLERDDVDLVQADAGLPGLALVLDPEAVHEQVAGAVGACGLRLRATSVDYVRYKPGTSVVASVRVKTDAGSSLGYVRAWSHDRGGPFPVATQTRKPSRPVRAWSPRVDDAAMVAVAPAGCDLRLPGVPKVLLESRRWLRRLDLSEADGPGDLTARVSVRELRYKPGRRLVGRIDVDGNPRGVAKAVRPPAVDHAVAPLREPSGAGAR